jgi:hypothetical protein
VPTGIRLRRPDVPGERGLAQSACAWHPSSATEMIRERTFEITFLAPGVEAYVFTFG